MAGAGHKYLLPLTDLREEHKILIIFYDQIGTGRSTHLRVKKDDATFWTFDLYIQELDNLVEHLNLREMGFYILGQSWGGMFCAMYASRRPRGLKKLVISSVPASVPLMIKELERMIAALPIDVRDTLKDCNRRGDYESSVFENAAAVFNAQHVCRLDPYPPEVQSAFKNLEDDPTAYLTLYALGYKLLLVLFFLIWENSNLTL
jgi:proline-specific peptidase